MKFVGCIVVLSILVNFSTQIPKLVNCPADFLEKNPLMADRCVVTTCQNELSISWVGCRTWICGENQKITYIPSDNTKTYPECCGGPVCSFS